MANKLQEVKTIAELTQEEKTLFVVPSGTDVNMIATVRVHYKKDGTPFNVAIADYKKEWHETIKANSESVSILDVCQAMYGVGKSARRAKAKMTKSELSALENLKKGTYNA